MHHACRAELVSQPMIRQRVGSVIDASFNGEMEGERGTGSNYCMKICPRCFTTAADLRRQYVVSICGFVKYFGADFTFSIPAIAMFSCR